MLVGSLTVLTPNIMTGDPAAHRHSMPHHLASMGSTDSGAPLRFNQLDGLRGREAAEFEAVEGSAGSGVHAARTTTLW